MNSELILWRNMMSQAPRPHRAPPRRRLRAWLMARLAPLFQAPAAPRVRPG